MSNRPHGWHLAIPVSVWRLVLVCRNPAQGMTTSSEYGRELQSLPFDPTAPDASGPAGGSVAFAGMRVSAETAGIATRESLRSVICPALVPRCNLSVKRLRLMIRNRDQLFAGTVLDKDARNLRRQSKKRTKTQQTAPTTGIPAPNTHLFIVAS